MRNTIKEIPLLCQTAMAQAILQDVKTQTRRLNGLDLVNISPDLFKEVILMTYQIPLLKEKNGPYRYYVFNAPGNDNVIGGIEPSKLFIKSPYGKPGDLLWVRETWLRLDKNHIITTPFAYKANSDPDTEEIRKDYIKAGYPYKWKPSIHMPKAACRIWLMVEEIRVERLHDISRGDAMEEGCPFPNLNGKLGRTDPVGWFRDLWKSINGEDSYQANPWVWVVKFRVLSKTGRPSEEDIKTAYESITSK